MKVLHTGDWHIGKLVHGLHMTQDQAYVLDQFIDLVKEEKPDVILIAGDLYDRSVPPEEAVDLLNQVLTDLVIDCQVPVVAIAGNHDSGDRLAFAGKLLEKHGLHIRGRFNKDFRPVSIGGMDIYPLPYIDPARIRDLYKDQTIKSHDQAMKTVLDQVKKNLDPNRINVAMAHAYVRGSNPLETSDSERPLSIGGSDQVDLAHFDGFDYVALGHLHGPQQVGRESVRYSGSLLKYSFSEVKQKKSVTLVDMDDQGQVTIRLHPLIPQRDMRVVEGRLEDLIQADVVAKGNPEDYMGVRLTDPGPLVNAIGKIRSVYPNMLQMEKLGQDQVDEEREGKAREDFMTQDLTSLFTDFYMAMTGQDLSEKEARVFEDLASQLDQGGDLS